MSPFCGLFLPYSEENRFKRLFGNDAADFTAAGYRRHAAPSGLWMRIAFPNISE
jgi:hypothetical protein